MLTNTFEINPRSDIKLELMVLSPFSSFWFCSSFFMFAKNKRIKSSKSFNIFLWFPYFGAKTVIGGQKSVRATAFSCKQVLVLRVELQRESIKLHMRTKEVQNAKENSEPIVFKKRM